MALKRWPGGIVSATPVVPSINAASGVWTLDEALRAQAQSLWPRIFAFTHVASAYAALGSGTSHNFGSLSIGAADSARHVIFSVSGVAAGTGGLQWTGATINGNAMTEVVAADDGIGSGNSAACAIYIYALATGTTAAFVATSSATVVDASYSIYRMVNGIAVPTAIATDADSTLSQSLTIPSGGAGLGVAHGNATSVGNATWTGLTENADFDTLNANNRHTAASSTTAGAATRSVAFAVSPTQAASMALAAFQPA